MLLACYVAALVLLALGSCLCLYGAWVCAEVEADVDRERGN